MIPVSVPILPERTVLPNPVLHTSVLPDPALHTPVLPERTVLITGATSGIGLAAAEEMAARGWQVLGVGRSPESCRKADAAIRAACPAARLAWFPADLAVLAEVNRLADAVGTWLDAGSRTLDVLINNAATVRSWYMATADGYEMQFAVNHLAGFLLAVRLRERLAGSPLGRVVTVSSGSHKGTRIRWDDIMNRRHYTALGAYKQSKLCNVLFTRAFNSRAQTAGWPVRAFAVDPGLVDTKIGSKWTGGLIARFWQLRSRHGISAWQAASALVWLCKMPPEWEPPADYYHNCAPADTSRAARDSQAANRLWELSARLCGAIEPAAVTVENPAAASGLNPTAALVMNPAAAPGPEGPAAGEAVSERGDPR